VPNHIGIAAINAVNPSATFAWTVDQCRTQRHRNWKH